MGKLANKVAIVTGASKGIGAGIAKGLAAEGAAVVAAAALAASPSRHCQPINSHKYTSTGSSSRPRPEAAAMLGGFMRTCFGMMRI